MAAAAGALPFPQMGRERMNGNHVVTNQPDVCQGGRQLSRIQKL